MTPNSSSDTFHADPETPSQNHDRHDMTDQPSPAENYSIQTNTSEEQERQATRSARPHLGITIRGCGPADGRPQPTLRAVDLPRVWFMIVSMGGWF